MSQLIAYADASGAVVIVNPAPGIDPNTLLSSVVPSGLTGIVIDSSTIPTSAQSLWAIDATGKITTLTPAPTGDQVDAERDRRLYGGFTYGGVAYQSRAVDIANITGACQLAFMAIVAGAKVGDYRWADPSKDFQWIAADNSLHSMDAQSVVLFSKQAAAFRSGLIVTARAIKNALLAGQTVDIYADSTWGITSTTPAQAAPTQS